MTRKLGIGDNVTGRVIEQHLPNPAKRFQGNFEITNYFRDSTLRGVAVDNVHVRDFDKDLPEKPAGDLLAAQSG